MVLFQQLFLMLVFCDPGIQAQGIAACRDLEVDEFYIRMHSSQNPLLLDTRSIREFQRERIPGAVLVANVADLEKMADSLDLDQPIFLYCENDDRSPVACRLLCERGFRHVYNLRGGLIEWRLSPYPLDRNRLRKKK